MVSREETVGGNIPAAVLAAAAKVSKDWVLPEPKGEDFAYTAPNSFQHAKHDDERASETEVTAAINKISLMVAETSGSPLQGKLRALLSGISRHSSSKELKESLNQAADILEDIRTLEAVEKADHEHEKHKEKMAHLWGEIGKLNKEIDKEFDKLSQWTTEEEKEQRERDKLRIEAAKAELDSAKTPQQRAAAAAKLDAVLRTAQNHNIDQLDKVDQRSGGQADTSVARAGIARLGELPSAFSQVTTEDALEKFNAREPLQTQENPRDSEATNKKPVPLIKLADPNASNSHLNNLKPTTHERA